MRLNQLDGLLAFVHVAERRGFSAAARSLGISPAALSQAVRALELRIGAPLLVRTTRSVSLTEAGERLLSRSASGLREAIAAIDEARAGSSEVTGRLRLTVPRLAVPLLEPVLPSLLRGHPRLEVEIDVDDQRVDILARGYDAGIRLSEFVERDMVAVRITPPFQFVVVGTPRYLRARGRPARPRDLLAHDCIGFRSATTGAVYPWEFERNGKQLQIALRGPVVTNDSMLMIGAAKAGLGLAYVSELQTAAEVKAGRLEVVLADYTPRVPGFFLYFPRRAQRMPKLRALIDSLAQQRGEKPGRR